VPAHTLPVADGLTSQVLTLDIDTRWVTSAIHGATIWPSNFTKNTDWAEHLK